MRPADLTPQQLAVFSKAAAQQSKPIEILLDGFRPDPWMPGSITGILPHCGLYGLMEPNGLCHT